VTSAAQKTKISFQSFVDERALRIIREAEYIGPCVVQSPGAWTRVGPTWIHPRHGWITVGLGAAEWGTSAGLAELASASTAKPRWHCSGTSVSPEPNIVFFCTEAALGSELFGEVMELTKQAEKMESGDVA